MTTEITSLHDVFADQLKDLYSAETLIAKALPKMAKAATAPDLKAGFKQHLEQTKEHAARLQEHLRDPQGQADGQDLSGHGRVGQRG